MKYLAAMYEKEVLAKVPLTTPYPTKLLQQLVPDGAWITHYETIEE